MTNIENINTAPSFDDGQFDEEAELEATFGLGGSTAGSMTELGRQAAERKARAEADNADTLRSFGGAAFEATNADPYYDVELKGTQEALGPVRSIEPAARDSEHSIAS